MKKYFMDWNLAFPYDKEDWHIPNSLAELSGEGKCYESVFLGTNKEEAIKVFKEKASFTVDKDLSERREVILINVLMEWECNEDGNLCEGREIEQYNLRVEYINSEGECAYEECLIDCGFLTLMTDRELVLEKNHNQEYPESLCKYV